MKQSVGIISLGCPRNLVDSESIAGRLLAKGYQIADIKDAEIGIVNTCAFIDEAKRESIDTILDLVHLKKQGKLKKLIVYGCLSQRYKEALAAELPEVDAFVGSLSFDSTEDRYPITPSHYAYLKICEGCVNHCSYCVIPKIKGRFRSLGMDDVIKKAGILNEQGVAELNIIGQDITGYGLDIRPKTDLARLLRQIIKRTPRIGWIRLLYLHPARIGDDVLKLIKDNPRICRYLDIPFQHVNDRILRLMNRQVSKKQIMRLIEKTRKMLPGVALRTSVITGFPSESEKEFEELLSFVRQVKFERLGAFIYSREEGTPAFGFKKQISKKVKISRFNAIMSLQRDISQELNQRLIGKKIRVLIDEEESGAYLGRSEYDAPEVDGEVTVSSSRKLFPGDFAQVRITDTLEYDLVGEA